MSTRSFVRLLRGTLLQRLDVPRLPVHTRGYVQASRAVQAEEAATKETGSSPFPGPFPILTCPPQPMLPDMRYGIQPVEERPAWFPFTLLRGLSNNMASSFLANQTSLEYFPDKVILGASLAAERVVEAIATNNRSFLQRTLDTKLYDALVPYIDAEVASPRSALTHLRYSSIEDAHIRDVWAALGSVDDIKSDKFIRIRAFTWTSLVPQGTPLLALPGSFFGAMEKGIAMYVDVEITGKIEGDHVDGGMRRSVWRFVTPRFSSAHKMEQAYKHGGVSDWKWKVLDIEEFLERKIVAEIKAARAKAEKARDPASETKEE